MTFGRMAHSMAVNVDVFDGLQNLSIVEHREGNPVRIDTGAEIVSLRSGDCFLLTPDRPYQAAWNSVSVTLTTVGFEDLQRDATWLVDHERLDVDFTRPITPAAGRHWSQTIRYVERVVSASPLLDSAPLARRELGWLVNSAVLACFPNSTLGAEPASYVGDAPQSLRRSLEFIDAHLRSLRMQRAHRDLQIAEPSEGTSVAAVAARWGFTHLGRFAIEYRRRFGINPSQTLRS